MPFTTAPLSICSIAYDLVEYHGKVENYCGRMMM